MAAEITARVSGESPGVPPSEVAALALESLRRTADAKVHTFRVILAERAVRSRLRQDRGRHHT